MPDYTPGPWKALESHAVVAGEMMVAQAFDGVDHDAAPNACLIATAPDLLEALHEIRSRIEARLEGGKGDEPLDGWTHLALEELDQIVFRAIAKAEVSDGR